MSRKSCLPSYVKCGDVYQVKMPDKLDTSEPPIVLAEVNVNTGHTPRPCVLIKFSEFINFTLLGLNPKFNIIYRLVKKDKCSKYAQILQEWEFEFESSEMLEIANVDTSQPTVLNYCDCLDEYFSNRIIYRLEIVQIETNNVKSYDLTNKSITATVISGLPGGSECYLPYIKCGKVFDPVLPLHLSKEDEPVVLTQLTINVERCNDICVLINFSGFITSILKDSHFNNLTFRLVKTCSDCTIKIIKEWPFRRAFVNDTNIKEPLVYNYCECLNSKFNIPCTYTIQLVEAELSEDSSYNISQKSMTAQVYPKETDKYYADMGREFMQFYSGRPYLKCGKICTDSFPNKLSQNNRPINLALLKVDTRNIINPHVIINYSQNIEFEIVDFNPKLSVVYRLIRKSNNTGYTVVLECWNYKVSEVIPSTVAAVNTIEPLVLNFCDCLGDSCDNSFTYILQTVETITENTNFNITNQEISAIVSYGNSNRE